MKIIIILSIILGAHSLQAQTPVAQFTYNGAGYRVYRTLINPSGFMGMPPALDTTGIVANRNLDKQNSKQESTDIKGMVSNAISIYPNPVVSDVTFKTTNVKYENADISIYDVTGKVVLKQKMEGLSAQINVASFYSGIYLVKVNGNGAPQFVSRIIKQ